MIVPQPPSFGVVDDDCRSDTSFTADGVATPSSTATGPSVSQDPMQSAATERHAFRDARISLAIDTSGSTAGPILAAEQAFAKSISQQLSPHARLNGRILPWSSSAQQVQSLAHYRSLKAGGGTMPSVLLDDPHHRRTLSQSSLWFLTTDGLIHQRDRAQFALKLARAGLHGTSCVVVLFADPGLGGLSTGNISVGISVFAIVPDCAFVYYNIRNGDMRLLQAKGAFHCLFKGQTPPNFHGNADWSTFPRVTPSDFADITLGKPQRLDANQIALQDQQVVNMDDLYANRLRPEEVSRILANEDNVASLIMTAQSRNQQHVFQGWIQQQRMPAMDITAAPRQDADGATKTAFRELLLAQQQRQPADNAPAIQARVRQAHALSMQQLAQQFQQKLALEKQREMLIQQAHARAGTSIDKASSLAPTSAYKPATMPPQMNVHPMATRPSGNEMLPNHLARKQAASGETVLRHLLHTSGFRSATGSFRGMCSICQTKETTLSLLFRSASGTSANQSDIQQDFPLALGFLPSLDVLSSTICCDPCSSLCVKLAMSGDSNEKIIAALPLVRLAENRAAFEKTLSGVFGASIAARNTPEVLLSILIQAIDRPNVDSKFQEAFRWASLDLLQSIPTTWSVAELDQTAPAPPLATTIQQALAMLEGRLLLECPLEGFTAILRAARLLGTPLALRRAAILRHFSYCATQGVLRKRNAFLACGRSKSQAIEDAFEGLLWRRCGSDGTQQRLPLLCTPPLLFAGSVVSTQSFALLRQSEEFRSLLDGEISWPGYVLALMMHRLQKLLAFDEQDSISTQALFSKLQEDEMVQKALVWPEKIREADVSAA